MNFSTRPPRRPTAALNAGPLPAWAALLGLGAAAFLVAVSAQAQDAGHPASAAALAAVAETASVPPRHPASDLARAFNFMDGNRDGMVSREEAAGFRGVAKNFDRADTSHDGFLSREEFDTAMNHVKAK